MRPTYRRPYAWLVATCLLLGTQIFLRLAILMAQATQRNTDIDAPLRPDFELSEEVCNLLGSRGMSLTLTVLTALCFLTWLHRAFRNLPALDPDNTPGATKARMSPRLAVGGWFIPLYNLVHGYRVLAQTWIESQPGDIVVEGQVLRRKADLVGGWWAAYLAANISTRLFLNKTPTTFEDWRIQSYLFMIPSTFAIVAAILAIRMVAGIDHRQERQHRDLVAAAAPPPAPDRPL